MPIDVPVAGNGSLSGKTQEKAAYHFPAFLLIRTVLMSPSMGRCQRTGMRPTPWTLSRRPSILKPLPTSFSPKLVQRCAPRKRG